MNYSKKDKIFLKHDHPRSYEEMEIEEADVKPKGSGLETKQMIKIGLTLLLIFMVFMVISISSSDGQGSSNLENNIEGYEVTASDSSILFS